MGREEEAALARAAADGDREAFGELVRRHQAAVLRLCLSFLRDRARAEDAAAEVFLKAHAALERFEGRASVSTWLHRIAANHCLDLLRRESRSRTEPLDERAGREGDPSSRLESSDLAARLLALLPEGQRLALVLREVSGLSYQEIAEALGCTLDSVKARLRRARATLQEGLRHFSGPADV